MARWRLSSRAKRGQRELSRKRDDGALFSARDWLWPPQGEEPLCIRELPEVELRAAKMLVNDLKSKQLSPTNMSTGPQS